MFNCKHEMVEYVGLTDRFMNCKLCGAKESDLVEFKVLGYYIHPLIGSLLPVYSSPDKELAPLKIETLLAVDDEIHRLTSEIYRQQAIMGEAKIKVTEDGPKLLPYQEPEDSVDIIILESKFRELVTRALKGCQHYSYEFIVEQLLVDLRAADDEENSDE